MSIYKALPLSATPTTSNLKLRSSGRHQGQTPFSAQQSLLLEVNRAPISLCIEVPLGTCPSEKMVVPFRAAIDMAGLQWLVSRHPAGCSVLQQFASWMVRAEALPPAQVDDGKASRMAVERLESRALPQ